MFAYAAAQVKKAMEVTKELGGEGYVLWGGERYPRYRLQGTAVLHAAGCSSH